MHASSPCSCEDAGTRLIEDISRNSLNLEALNEKLAGFGSIRYVGGGWASLGFKRARTRTPDAGQKQRKLVPTANGKNYA